MSNGGAERYGGFDLARGDRDGPPPIWGGAPQAAGADPGSPPGHVRALQQDLRTLGFGLVGEADGAFGIRTSWAVREFQIYARMQHAAREDVASGAARYTERLSRVSTGAQRYRGAASGVVNAGTRTALEHWIRNDWRCPVVIEAWRMLFGMRFQLRAENLWLHDELDDTGPRMYARDLSGYYDFPPDRDEADPIVIGDYARFPVSAWGRTFSGPRSVPPRHTWSEGELLPEGLAGTPADQLTGARLSTFKVVRAVSEVECLGFFDSVNSYDNAFVSTGPCHWTLGIVDREGGVSKGELCGFLAYLAFADPEAFERAFGAFGLAIDADWVHARGQPDERADGRDLFLAGQRKYVAWVGLEQEGGGARRLGLSEREGDYFKTWHWFYRFVMAGRTVEGYRRRMWDMARMRLRDILGLPWGEGVAGLPDGAEARIADVVTSEKAMALLLRWHIRFPADVVVGGRAGRRLREALARAAAAEPGLDWDSDPRAWGDAHEAALLAGLLAEVKERGNQGLIDTVGQVVRWPTWGMFRNPRGYRLPGLGGLSEARGSFELDAEGLPPAPP